MAYVSDSKWDIFISYPLEAEAWTSRFAQELRVETQLSGVRDLQIYYAGRDWRLGAASVDMLDAARNSALFVAVLNRDSLVEVEKQKRFLLREMEKFRESGAVKDRFCPILLYPVDPSQLSEAMPIDGPEAFWNTNSNFFYDEGDGIPLLLTPDSEPKRGEYRRRVEKVAHQLRVLLDELRTRSEEARINNQGPFAGKTVFLAGKGVDTYVEEEWQTVRRALLGDGATVVPAPERNDVSRQTDLEALRNADLFVQLFYFDQLDDAKAQFEAAAAEAASRTDKADKPLPILRWRKRNPDPKADSLRLEKLPEEDQVFCECSLTGTFEEFKSAISDKLEELRKPPPPPRLADEGPYLYIAADKSDRDFAIKLQARAREYTVADVMTRDETQQREDFIAGLTQASGIVFLYGNAEASFIEAWSKEFIRNASLSKLRPKFANRKWLYLAPPEKGPSGELMLPFDVRNEGSQEAFTLEGIEKICAELCGDSHR